VDRGPRGQIRLGMSSGEFNVANEKASFSSVRGPRSCVALDAFAVWAEERPWEPLNLRLGVVALLADGKLQDERVFVCSFKAAILEWGR
jgi:hypothetical protein